MEKRKRPQQIAEMSRNVSLYSFTLKNLKFLFEDYQIWDEWSARCNIDTDNYRVDLLQAIVDGFPVGNMVTYASNDNSRDYLIDGRCLMTRLYAIFIAGNFPDLWINVCSDKVFHDHPIDMHSVDDVDFLLKGNVPISVLFYDDEHLDNYLSGKLEITKSEFENGRFEGSVVISFLKAARDRIMRYMIPNYYYHGYSKDMTPEKLCRSLFDMARYFEK